LKNFPLHDSESEEKEQQYQSTIAILQAQLAQRDLLLHVKHVSRIQKVTRKHKDPPPELTPEEALRYIHKNEDLEDEIRILSHKLLQIRQQAASKSAIPPSAVGSQSTGDEKAVDDDDELVQAKTRLSSLQKEVDQLRARVRTATSPEGGRQQAAPAAPVRDEEDDELLRTKAHLTSLQQEVDQLRARVRATTGLVEKGSSSSSMVPQVEVKHSRSVSSSSSDTSRSRSRARSYTVKPLQCSPLPPPLDFGEGRYDNGAVESLKREIGLLEGNLASLKVENSRLQDLADSRSTAESEDPGLEDILLLEEECMRLKRTNEMLVDEIQSLRSRLFVYEGRYESPVR